ncbi:hypothetical protein AMECASPLE_022826 [Ameca splendens]|uniref:Secreted protein n=1 Tax=Ameca splendens TaxID=208324 RepID=A0ABV1AA93_9TELE
MLLTDQECTRKPAFSACGFLLLSLRLQRYHCLATDTPIRVTMYNSHSLSWGVLVFTSRRCACVATVDCYISSFGAANCKEKVVHFHQCPCLPGYYMSFT